MSSLAQILVFNQSIMGSTSGSRAKVQSMSSSVVYGEDGVPSTAGSGINAPRRVTYQGITYAICGQCFDVIGSGRTESSLLALERAHDCKTRDSELRKDDASRVQA